MAGGMMSQVTGMIPGMKKEEEVPDVAPQEGEYQEYTVIFTLLTIPPPSEDLLTLGWPQDKCSSWLSCKIKVALKLL